MNSRYARAYTEVLEIISHFSEEEYSKIPEEKIKFYKENMDKEYIFKINPEEDLSKQNISKEANAVLITIFRDYFATEEQKKNLENILDENQRKLEEERRKKYNPNNIFTKEDSKVQKQSVDAENKEKIALIENKESFFNRFTNFIKKILKIK